MQIELTGNPFVDTGLAVISSLKKLSRVTDLTHEHMLSIHGDGEDLAERNSKLKSFSMIFTKNSWLIHPSMKPPEMRKVYYKTITTEFLKNIGHETINAHCESCGNEKTLDLNKIIKRSLVPLGIKDEEGIIGRQWFPLAGSLGSDAQSLPAASRGPHICAKCLFAVNYLPLGIILMNGRLAVYQCNSPSFWYEIIRNTVEEYLRQIPLGKYDTIGKNEGNIVVLQRIFAAMSSMQKSGIKFDHDTTLFVWKFSNSGTGSSCEINEIPNKALIFLWQARGEGHTAEIYSLVANEKNPKFSLLESISKGSDYWKLYPSKKSQGVSPKFFRLYQTTIRNKSIKSLNTALEIAKYIYEKKNANEINEKQLNILKKKELENDRSFQNQIRRFIIEMIEKNRLQSDDYAELFPYVDNTVKVSHDGWKILRYYLHNFQLDTYQADNTKLTTIRSDIKRLAFIIFTEFKERKGVDRFKKDVYDAAKHGKLNTSWLKRQFLINARKYSGFTYDDWKSFCFQMDGKETTWELLYQLRLLWAELLNQKDFDMKDGWMDHPTIHDENDLPQEIIVLLEEFTKNFIENRGIEKFHELVLEPILKNEVGLFWFRKQLSRYDPKFKDDECWDNLCIDKNGNSFKNGRLFQMSLFISNVFRQNFILQKEV